MHSNLKTPRDCRHACEQHPRCIAFTYVKSEKTCWLKGAGYSSSTNDNTISGVLNASLAQERERAYSGRGSIAANEWEQEPAFQSRGEEGEEANWPPAPEDDEGIMDDQGMYDVDGPDQNGASSSFSSHHRHGRRDGDDDDADDDQMLMAHEVTAEEVAKYNDSTSLFGDIAFHRDVVTPAECESLCLAHPSCVAFTFDKEEHDCMLRLLNVSSVRFSSKYIGGRLSDATIAARASQLSSNDGGSEPPRDSVGAAAEDPYDVDAADHTGASSSTPQRPVRIYTGRAWPLPEDFTDASTDDNIDLKGGDIAEEVDVDTVAGCRALCAARTAEPRCTAFTLSKARTICYLKASNYTRVQVDKSAALVSAVAGAAVPLRLESVDRAFSI